MKKSFLLFFTVLTASFSAAAQTPPDASPLPMRKNGELSPPPFRRPPPPPYGTAARLQTMEGKVLGLFVNSHPAAQSVLSRIYDAVKQKHPNTKVRIFTAAENTDIADGPRRDEYAVWLQSVDAVISGIADDSPDRSEHFLNSVRAERGGRPAVLLGDSQYLKKNLPNPFADKIRTVGINTAELTQEELDRVVNDVERALTAPLSDEEKAAFERLPTLNLPDASPNFREKFEKEWSLVTPNAEIIASSENGKRPSNRKRDMPPPP